MTTLMDAVLANLREARSTLPAEPPAIAQQDQADAEWRAHLEALGLPPSAAVGEVIVAVAAVLAKRLDALATRSALPPAAADLGHAVLGEAAFFGLSLAEAGAVTSAGQPVPHPAPPPA